MAENSILSIFRRRRDDEFPDKDSPEYRYTEAVLQRHKLQGQELALRVRWFALGAIAILLLFLVPWPDVFYYEFILALLAVGTWAEEPPSCIETRRYSFLRAMNTLSA